MTRSKFLDPLFHCLIIDDSVFDQEMMRRVATKAISNVVLRAVCTLEGARKALMEGPVSLILLDNSLPDGKGADFAVELAQYPKMAKIPIIIASDWPSPFMWDKADSAGVKCVVTKSDLNPDVVRKVLKMM